MKFISAICATVLALGTCILVAYSKNKDFDKSLPSLNKEDGWEQTLNTDFSKYSSIDEVYKNSPWGTEGSHGKRKTEYWCDQALQIDKNKGALVIKSTEEDNHNCSVCNQNKGIFTGCLETRETENNKGFKQAFGYYEVVCKVPDAPGMWSAFWLQSDGVSKVGNKGKDGTEIDVFESSFHQKNRTKTGNALHYDAYSQPWYKCVDNVTNVGYDVYDGQIHKYALHWTPKYYVFYVDDKPVWATDAGDVSRVPSFLRLTVEIRGDVLGPYGQKLGAFENRTDGSTDFEVKSVKVWQKESYKEHIKQDSDFKDKRKIYDKILHTSLVVGGTFLVASSVCASVAIKRKIRK